jgi:bacterioferritin-associated ferredoxin
MYVCICNGITEKQVRQAAESGISSLWDLQKELGVASNCGKCGETAVEIMRETRNANRAEPIVYFPCSA